MSPLSLWEILNGKLTLVPLEVALLFRVGALVEDNDVTPALLDWYSLGSLIIMVMERPDQKTLAPRNTYEGSR